MQNDDPVPTITVPPVADRVTEGNPLKWKVCLSEAADVDVSEMFVAVPVTGGPELSTKDVDPAWLAGASGESPDPERPLSQVKDLYLGADVPKGSAEVPLPTVKDRVTEPAESVLFRLTNDNGDPQPGGPVLTGTVLDAP